MALFFSTVSIASAEEDSLVLGAMLGVDSSVYKGVDNKLSPMPLVSYRKGRFFIDGMGVGFSLLDQEKYQFNVYGTYDGNGYKESDSLFFRGMQKRKNSIDAGLSGDIVTDIGMFSLDFSADISDTHNGYQATVAYGLPLFEAETISVMASAGITWQSENLVEYYYGVRANEARAGRPAYSPDATLNGFAGVDLDYHPWDDWGFLVQLQLESLGREIRNSPLVDKNYSAAALFVVQYRFW